MSGDLKKNSSQRSLEQWDEGIKSLDKEDSAYTTDEEGKEQEETSDNEDSSSDNNAKTMELDDETEEERKKNILKRFFYAFFPEPGTEGHRSQMGTAGWLRAAVLGANDALVSVAAIIVGVAANTNSTQGSILVAGLAGLIAGACSMAVGEYVSVCAQRDLEHADMKKEKWELENNWDGELEELSLLYQERGVEPRTAKDVATQLMAKDALRAHAMDELGIRDFTKARPMTAGIASFLTFLFFGSIPFLASVFIPNRFALIGVCVGVTLFLLAISGAIGSYFGGAAMWKGALRVTVGGFFAMAITAGIGIATDYSGAEDLNF